MTTKATTNAGDLTPDTIKEELDRARATLERVTNNGADPRVIGLWKSRVSKMETMLVDAEARERDNQRAKEEAKSSPSTTAPSRLSRKGSIYCLCGCGKANNPSSRFQQGHDARLKGQFRKLESGAITVEDLPQLVQDILNDPQQTTFKRCSKCNSPFLGSGDVGPICSAG